LSQNVSTVPTAPLNPRAGRAGAARCLGIACTDQTYHLDFTVWSEQNGCAAADLVPGSGRRIWGVLYDVPDVLIRRETAGGRRSMDEIEAEGEHYRRTRIALRDPLDAPIEAITYLVLQPVPELRTSAEYVGHILRGLRENSIPLEYVEYVERRVLANNPELAGAVAALGHPPSPALVPSMDAVT
jgi:hypothetical protein